MGVRRDDDIFKQSLAELSRRAGERAAQRSTLDPSAAARARHAALQAYDRTRARRLRLALGFTMGAVVGSGIAALVATVGSPPAPTSASAAMPADRAAPIEMASATSPPPQSTSPVSPSPAPAPPSSVANPPAVAAVGPAPAAVAADGQPAPVETPASASPLQRDEVREVQARLRSFGFNPGPVDGLSGRTTEAAVMHYQQQREQLQTGKVDRRLLEQLRQDAAPQVAPPDAQRVAQRAARPDARTTRSRGARSADPFEPVREAGDRVGRWLDSVLR